MELKTLMTAAFLVVVMCAAGFAGCAFDDSQLEIVSCSEGTPCPSGQTCVAGQCVNGDIVLVSDASPTDYKEGTCVETPCADGELCCSGVCFDPSSDINNCGACSNVCGDSESCADGACTCGEQVAPRERVAACLIEEGEVCCSLPEGGSACRNLLFDDDHCGACGAVCDVESNLKCTSGDCGCASEFGICPPPADVTVPPTECPISYLTDVANCLGCGNVCEGNLQCIGSGCSCGSQGICEGELSCCDLPLLDGETEADRGCIDTENDPVNCGGCGVTCGSGENCVVGACVCGTGGACTQDEFCCKGVTCISASRPEDCLCGDLGRACDPTLGDAGPACCDTAGVEACHDLTAETQNCGACGVACPIPGQICNGGVCVCPAGQTMCNGSCVPLGTTANCAGCGHTCAAEESCCSSGGTNICVDTRVDIAHCGACNSLCGTGDCTEAPNGDGVCGCGGQSVDLSISIVHCGQCGNNCNDGRFVNAGAVCNSGVCVRGACNGGFDDCDSDPTDCEVDTTTDADNCGTCDTACGGTAQCVASSCVCGQTACPQGAVCCDQNGNDQCTNTETSNFHCGGCGVECSAGEFCVAGACLCAGTTNCGAGETCCGAECVDTETSLTHCGGCSQGCDFINASESCVTGTCNFGTCDTDFADCTGGLADGCEVNTATDTGNCGGCGNDCTPPGHGWGRCTLGLCQCAKLGDVWQTCTVDQVCCGTTIPSTCTDTPTTCQ